MHIDSEVSPVCCKTPLHRHKFSNWCTVLERFSFYQVLFFSCVRLISFLVVSAKMSGWEICRIKLHRTPRKEIRISAQVCFQAVNGLCLAEFKQWPSSQMGDKFSPIFRSLLRLAARRGGRTQRRIAVKMKGKEDFVAWQKAVGIFKVLVITKFSNFLQRPNSIFVAVPTGSVFCRCLLCRN